MIDVKPLAPPHSAVAFVQATLLRAVLVLAMLAGAIPMTSAAWARIIPVGPQRLIKLPSQAAMLARDGDRILIDPGVYRDCAYWHASHLLIEGRGPGVIIGGQICAERAIFIIAGQNTTVRGITFTQAHSIYHNAAGILGIGDNLTVEQSRFLDNENGILTGGSPASRVRIVTSEFRDNGSCAGACAHGIYIGATIGLAEIDHCRFRDTRTAHHIKSRAMTTVVTNSMISDGEAGTSSYLIDIPNGGNVLIEDNVLQKGARSSNPTTAISIGVEGVKNPTNTLVIRDNRFSSDLPAPTTFVRNSTTVAAELSGNTLTGQVVALHGPGTVDGAPGVAAPAQ